jgi:hypothetical protein
MGDSIRDNGPSLGASLRAAAADPAVDPKYVPILIRAAELVLLHRDYDSLAGSG